MNPPRTEKKDTQVDKHVNHLQ
ncbi:hypothetical protein CAEBREN_15802 [Caenorhabditis brenneri]|uniref:Uncharacterized protein n=1 Tax=Caenorhabditis brenneri TaxID=135651 RepID=G0MFN4_CAEBE|nr:hypothetical protein CAEBREN_15802 [Caenorhabditis brenneri]